MSDPTSPSPVTYHKPILGCLAWLNIPCTSVPRAREFYTSIFGWTFFSPPGTSSDTFSPFKISGSTVMGALTKSNDEKKDTEDNGSEEGITIYILVEDVEDTLKKVVTAGGKVKMEKTVEGGHTEMGRFWDTEGTVIGVLRWLI